MAIGWMAAAASRGGTPAPPRRAGQVRNQSLVASRLIWAFGQSFTPGSHSPILHPERASRRSHERSRRSKIDLDAAEATVMLDYR